MTTITRAPVSRWIDSVCRQFTEATGSALHFAPAGSPRAERLEQPSASQACWASEINDGESRLGFLFIDLPEEQRIDRTFLGVCDLAALVSELVSGQYSAARKLDARSRQLETLVEVGLSLPNDDNVPTALRRLLNAALKLTGFRSVGFFLLDGTTQELRLRLDEHLEPRTIPQVIRGLATAPFDTQALTEGWTLLRRTEEGPEAGWLPADILMACCLRVPSKAGPMGTLWAFDRRAREPSDREVHVLQSIAVQIAAALERIVLLQESAVKERLQNELRVASENHLESVQHEPLRDGRIEAAGFSRSHKEVGGDLCEIIPLDEHRTLIAVGDAAGHSIPASLVMSAVRGSLRTMVCGPLGELLATDSLMRRINAALFAITPPHQFMSLIVGIVDSESETFTYTNAGHPTPLVVHDGHPAATTSHGMLLGVASDTLYDRSVLKLSGGDLIVLYSDGISEARNRSRRMFRSDGILDAVKSRHGASADSVLQGILAEYDLHTEGRGEGDDRTLLVVRLRPAAHTS